MERVRANSLLAPRPTIGHDLGMGVTIRAAGEADSEAISALVSRVSEEFVTPDFTPEGRDTLLRSMTPESIRERIRSDSEYLAAFGDERNLVGVLAIRHRTHVFHLFVAASHQRRGIATRLWRRALADGLVATAEDDGQVTVNSSRFAEPFYERLGFVRTGDESTVSGVTVIPMRLPVDSMPA